MDKRTLRDGAGVRTAGRLVAVTAVAVLVGGAAAPGAVAGGTVASRAVAGSTVTAEDQTSSTDGRVLQSVAATMAPDGTLTGISGTVVTSGTDTDTDTETTYTPEDVVDDLPVRVLTAYRTAKGSGTDLADLAGYTGRVRIDLTVQNLTVRPQELTYDVDGASRSESALVGAPLTVVASAALDGTDASSVVTEGRSAADPVTNGVLSQAVDGSTQVQWATILAPPQLGSSATLSLVVDADDFELPTFDLSVQPGLVTDPSVGALVDAAFNPGSSSELQLESRTIELVTEVNTVLARAGSTIANVRSTLSTSADTLGTKTVADLRTGAARVASSMRSLDGSVKSLGSDLSTSLRSTRSTVLSQLQQSVQSVDRMLGDTTAHPPTAHTRGTGCDTTVPAAKRSGSVYGTLLQVVSQLDGYARATGACKASLQSAILDSVGPAEPSEETCKKESVTCALYGARTRFGAIAQKLVDSGDSAVDALEPKTIQDAVDETVVLDGRVQAVSGAVAALAGDAPLQRVKVRLGAVTQALGDARSAASDVKGVAGSITGTVQTATGELDQLAEAQAGLARQLCDYSSSGTLTDTDVQAMLAAVLVSPSCADPAAIDKSDTRVYGQLAHWQAVTDTVNGQLAQSLATLDGKLAVVGDRVQEVGQSADEDSRPVTQQIKALDDSVRDLQNARDDVARKVKAVNDQHAQVVAAVRAAFRAAADDASEQVNNAVDPEIRQISTKSAQDREELGRMFDQSASGLSAAAAGITRDGARLIRSQKVQFGRQEAAAGRQISGELEDGLSAIASGVTSATRDTEAAGTLLAGDLNRVLLDLGDRRVHGSGLLGAMATSAATARSADYQLALATDRATSYANVRSASIGAIMLRQAQSDAALQLQADLPAFRLDLPAGTEHRTVYSFHLAAE